LPALRESCGLPGLGDQVLHLLDFCSKWGKGSIGTLTGVFPKLRVRKKMWRNKMMMKKMIMMMMMMIINWI